MSKVVSLVQHAHAISSEMVEAGRYELALWDNGEYMTAAQAVVAIYIAMAAKKVPEPEEKRHDQA